MYEDFPILTNQDYVALNEEYAKQQRYSKQSCLNNIMLTLNECKEFYFALTKQVNENIAKALNEVKSLIETISANTSTLCENQSRLQEVRQTNIFEFINNLVKISSLNFELYVKEDKEYVKKIASANIALANEGSKILLSALKNSNFRLFRFM